MFPDPVFFSTSTEDDYKKKSEWLYQSFLNEEFYGSLIMELIILSLAIYIVTIKRR